MCVCAYTCAGVTGRWERNQACSALVFGIFTTPSRGHEGKNLITANPARTQVAAETAALFWLLTKAEQVYVFLIVVAVSSLPPVQGLLPG